MECMTRRLVQLSTRLALLSGALPSLAFATDLFWNDAAVGSDRVRRCAVASCTPTDFESVSPNLQGDLAIDPIEGMVYFAVGGSFAGTSKIQRKPLSGGAVQDMLDMSLVASSTVTGMAVDPVARQVYVATPGTSVRIRRFSIDNPGTSTVVALYNETGCNICSPQGLAVDVAGGYLYWADLANGKIARRALDLATPIQDVVTGLAQPNGLVLDPANDRIYFIDGIPNRSLRYALFSSPTTISPLIAIGGLGCAGCLELDPGPGALGEMYLSLQGDGEIRHCDLDAGCPSLVLLTSGTHNCLGLALLGAPSIPAIGVGGVAVSGLLLVLAAAIVRRRRWSRLPVC